MWMTYFLRKHVMTFPSRFLNVPRTTVTTSSLRIGTARTLYFLRSSADSDADMRTRRSEEGAWKWARRDLRRELDTSADCFMVPRQAGGR